jgi:TP901 family phage tail tape measure protein
MSKIQLNIVALGDFSSVNTQIAGLQAQVAGLGKSLAGVGIDSALTKELNSINAVFKQTMLSTGQFTQQTVRMQTETEKFGAALEAGKLKLSDYFNIVKRRSSEATTQMRALALEQTKLQNSIVVSDPTKQGMFSVFTPTQINKTANATKIAANEANLYAMAVNKGSQALINWGKNTQWAGRQLTVGMSVPLLLFGQQATTVFKEVNDQLVRLQKVYGIGLTQPTKQALDQIKAQVLGLSKELASTMGIAAKDTAAMAADLAATGKTGNDLIVATREAMRLSKLGELDTQSAMKATVSLQNVYKLSTQQLTGAVDFLNAVENQTSTSLQDLVDGIPRVGPIVQQLGGSFKDTAIMMVAMKEAGVPAAQSANAIKSAIASLINPTKQAKDAFKAYNIDLGNIATATGGNPVKMIMMLQSALKGLAPLAQAQLIEKLFGKFQEARIQALITNLGAVNSQTKTAFDLMNASDAQLASVAKGELKTATESVTGKWQRAIETMKTNLIPVGQKIIELATKLLDFGNSVSKVFSSIPAPLKGIMGALAIGVALSGPVIMLTGLIGNFVGYLIRGVFNLKQLITGGKTLGQLLSPQFIAAENAAKMFGTEIMSEVDAVKLLDDAIRGLTASMAGLTGVQTTGTAEGVAGLSRGKVHRSHLTPRFAEGSAQDIQAKAVWHPEVQKLLGQYIYGVSNLTAELPEKVNTALVKGMNSEKFTEKWNSLENKLLRSADISGLNISDPKIVQATKTLEDAIGKRAVELGNGTVSDRELSQATQDVLIQFKGAKGAMGLVVSKFQVLASQLGESRINIPTDVLNKLVDEGKIVRGTGNSYYVPNIKEKAVSQVRPGETTSKKRGKEITGTSAQGERLPSYLDDRFPLQSTLSGLALPAPTATALAEEAAAATVATFSYEEAYVEGLKKAGISAKRIQKMNIEEMTAQGKIDMAESGMTEAEAYNSALAAGMEKGTALKAARNSFNKTMGIGMVATMLAPSIGNMGGGKNQIAGTAGSVLNNVGMATMMRQFLPEALAMPGIGQFVGAVAALTLAYKGLSMWIGNAVKKSNEAKAALKSANDEMFNQVKTILDVKTSYDTATQYAQNFEKANGNTVETFQKLIEAAKSAGTEIGKISLATLLGQLQQLGYSVANALMISKAASIAGVTPDMLPADMINKTRDELRKERDATVTANADKITQWKKDQATALKSQNTPLTDQITIQEAKLKKDQAAVKAAQDQLKAQEKITAELKAQNDFRTSQMDLDSQIATARVSGNYLLAATLQQQKVGASVDFANQNKSSAAQKRIDDLQAIVDKQQSIVDKLKADKVAQDTKDSITSSIPKPVLEKVLTNAEIDKMLVPWGDSLNNNTKAIEELTKAISPLGTDKTSGVNTITQGAGSNKVTTSYISPWDLPKGVQAVTGTIFTDPKSGQKYKITGPSSLSTGGQVPVQKLAFGGLVSGLGNSYSDSVRAMLSHGEYVVNASAVKNFGVSNLDAINSGRGISDSSTVSMVNNFTFKIDGNSGDANQLADTITKKVINTLNVTMSKNNKTNKVVS